MKKWAAISWIMSMISTNLLAGTGDKGTIEVGDFRVEYQIMGTAKTLVEARKSCASQGTWRLPTGVDFFATLMTGHTLFTTVPFPREDGDIYLGWVEENETSETVEGHANDILMVTYDGHGTDVDFTSLSKIVNELTAQMDGSSEEERKTQTYSRGVKGRDILKQGVQVVCFRNLEDKK